jgi:hypothetical protein
MISPSGPATQRSNRQAVYRKVGIIHGTRYRSAIMRNLSASGALVEGVEQLPHQSLIVVDLGDGQLTFARVVRANGRQLGIAFEEELVDDGNGGLCTGRRVSPYTLATAGLPNPGDPDKDIGGTAASSGFEGLAQRLGLTLAARAQRPAPLRSLHWSSHKEAGRSPTFAEISEQYLGSLFGDEEALESARQDLHAHVLPHFGETRLDQVSEPDILAWLAAKETPQADQDAGADGQRLRS